jgi:hypothetical protein
VGLEVRTSMGDQHDPAVPTRAGAIEVQIQAEWDGPPADLMVDLHRWTPGAKRALLGGEWQVPRAQYRALVLLRESPAE